MKATPLQLGSLRVSRGEGTVIASMTDPAPEDGPDYACQMTDPDEADEQRRRLSTLFDAADSIDRVEGGLRLALPREGELAETAARFAILESRCCPWARYGLVFRRDLEGIELSITGDEQAAELIRQYPEGQIPDGLDVPSFD